MAIDWGRAFNRAIKTTGEVVKAKDKDIQAEAKASAEAFAEAQEKYENEITGNKQSLTKEVESISGLVNGDVGKIRTIMNTYGNADVVKQLQKDFETYQVNTFSKNRSTDSSLLKFKTLGEYINGKITGAGTGLMSDQAAEQKIDEDDVVDNELNVAKAAKKAKDMGVSLADYLENQARKMSNRPAFSVDAKAARLVEESKMGIFGKTLTMEEARQKVTGGQVMGEDAKDLGDTGFALAREGNLSAEQIYKITSGREKMDKDLGLVLENDELQAERNSIAKELSVKGFTSLVEYNSNAQTFELKNTKESQDAALKIINDRLKPQAEGVAKLSKKSIAVLERIKAEIEGKSNKEKKGVNDAIEEVKKNPKLIKDFVKKYPNYKLPPELQKLLPNMDKKDDDKIETKVIPKDGNVGTYNGKTVVVKEGVYRILDRGRLGKVLNPTEIKNIVKGS
jgi:hypothetical protein